MAGIAEVAKEAGVDGATVKEVLNSIKALSANGSVVIQGFGVFKMKTRKARTARNPQGGDDILVPERQVFTFKASKK